MELFPAMVAFHKRARYNSHRAPMNLMLSHIPNRPLRAAAAAVAILCLWMATAGVLGHTDEFGITPSASATAVLNAAGAIAPQADVCAACDWLAALHACAPALGQALVPHVYCAWQFPALESVFFTSQLHQSGSRAPPFLS